MCSIIVNIHKRKKKSNTNKINKNKTKKQKQKKNILCENGGIEYKLKLQKTNKDDHYDICGLKVEDAGSDIHKLGEITVAWGNRACPKGSAPYVVNCDSLRHEALDGIYHPCFFCENPEKTEFRILAPDSSSDKEKKHHIMFDFREIGAPKARTCYHDIDKIDDLKHHQISDGVTNIEMQRDRFKNPRDLFVFFLFYILCFIFTLFTFFLFSKLLLIY